MDQQEVIAQAKRILKLAHSQESGGTAYAEALEFVRVYAGERSSFYAILKAALPTWSNSLLSTHTTRAMSAYVRYLENGLGDGLSIERKARNDVVSDILEQAHALLETPGVHPAAPAVLIGAALEEYLRTWIEDENVDRKGKKSSIDSYATALREADLIKKQDSKDITSWAGLRNHAAHGDWSEVDDKKRIALMLEGVNLFMRTYG